MSSVIRLSIKAANGSVSDFSVEAESSWTFRQLKNHLYRHYPTHPPLASQKLIHSGKLLEDTQTLATLATSLSSAVESVIVVHLVAYQRSQSSPAVVSESSTEPVSRQSSLTTVKEDNDAPAQQQEASPQPQPAGPPPPPWLRYRGQTSPTMMRLPPQFYLPPYEAAYAQQMALWYQNYYATATSTTVPVAPPLERDAVNVEQPLNEGQDGVEVEDDVPVHAAGGAAGLGMMAGGGGGGGGRNRRDLVDVVYMLTMFGFLGLVAYLTGSLGRLVVFAGGILFVLLNQGGWFAVRRRRQAAPVADDVNPLNRPEQVGAAAAGGAGQQQEVPPEDTPPTDAPEPQQAQDEQRQGILATLFIFVTSFFTSLIPHQRPELQAN